METKQTVLEPELEKLIKQYGLFTVAGLILHTVFNRLKADPKLYLSLEGREAGAYTDVIDYCEGIALLEYPEDGMSEDEEDWLDEEELEGDGSNISPEVRSAFGVGDDEKLVL